jgi:osmotically-inducible protein OsmY
MKTLARKGVVMKNNRENISPAGSRAVWVWVLLFLGLTGFRGDYHVAKDKVSDLQIQIASQKRLDMDSRLEQPRKITVKSVNRMVTLGGTVGTYRQKLLAENIVGSTLVGIKGIDDQIRVVPDPVLDGELTSQARDALRREPGLRGVGVKAAVKNGVIRLTGTVKTAGQVLLAEEAVSSLRGVVDVDSALKVVPEKRPDKLIADQVFYYLDMRPIRTDEIRSTVKDGVVSLSGKADNFKDVVKVMKDIQNMRGVAAVDSSVEVL